MVNLREISVVAQKRAEAGLSQMAIYAELRKCYPTVAKTRLMRICGYGDTRPSQVEQSPAYRSISAKIDAQRAVLQDREGMRLIDCMERLEDLADGSLADADKIRATDRLATYLGYLPAARHDIRETITERHEIITAVQILQGIDIPDDVVRDLDFTPDISSVDQISTPQPTDDINNDSVINQLVAMDDQYDSSD